MGALEFLNPTFLFFLPLILIPLIIHLFQKRKVAVLPFAPIELLRISQRELKKRIVVKNLLLLLTKLLLVAVLVLAFAKPVFVGQNKKSGMIVNRDILILLDRSSSMTYLKAGSSLFDEARKNARDLVTDSFGNERFALWTFDRKVDKLVDGFTTDKMKVLRHLDRTRTGRFGTDLSDALGEVATMVEANRSDREVAILVYTDFAGASFSDEQISEKIARISTNARIEFVDLSAGLHLENVAVTSVTSTIESGIIDLSLRLTNTLQTYRSVRATLYLNDRKSAEAILESAQTELTFSINQSALAETRPPFQDSGKILARLHFDDTVFTIDNDYFFTIMVRPFIKAAILTDGTNKEQVFFLLAALNPSMNQASRINPEALSLEQFENDRLNHFDLLIIPGIGSLPPLVVSRMGEYLRSGKMVFLSLSGDIDLDFYNDNLPDFPWHILGKVEQETGLGVVAGIDQKVIETYALDLLHFSSVRCLKFYSVSPLPGKETSILLALENGAPLVLSARIGSGTMFLLTSALDGHWNNLPFTSVFLPFLHELVLHSVSSEKAREEWSFSFDDDFYERDLREKSGQSLSVQDDSGREVAEIPIENGSRSFTFSTLDPGTYAIFRDDGPGKAFLNCLTLNYQREESDLTRRIDRPLAGGGEPGKGSGQIVANAERTKLWPFFLLFLLLLLAGEYFILTRG